jgi:cytochrome c biogenesis protein ResB
MPFSIRLDNFEKVDHPGIATAKEYRSDVTQRTGQDDRRVRIEMNDPLRDKGLILFQSSWGPQNAAPGDELFSVFSVVRNPSDHWPLYSCIVIAIGMAITFIQKFLAYSKRQAKKMKEVAR